MEDNSNKNPHAIMISFPLQGHITPFVHLALNLASKGFTITFIHTHSTHHQITTSQPLNSTTTTTTNNNNIFSKAIKSGLDIRYKTVSDGLPLNFKRSSNNTQFWDSILNVFPTHVDEMVGEIVGANGNGSTPVSCLVADTFYVGTEKVAEKYGLVNVSFWTEPALVFSLYYHLDLMIENQHFSTCGSGNSKDAIDYIPGVKTIQRQDLISNFQGYDKLKAMGKVSYKAFQQVRNVDFILCNTVQELESVTILALNQNQPIYAIGPTFPLDFTKPIVATSMLAETDCTHWLNTKPRGTVLYVSFGSYAHVTKHDVVEIAHGLLLSKVSFIWVLRPDIVISDDTSLLPVGFEDDVKDRGLIVSWCNQRDVISHMAIGGFLTHCGWNSILESIWCGVPFICFPLVSDQFTNRKLVVGDWKIGINLCDKTTITRDEVSEKISHLMSEKTSMEVRREIMVVRETLKNALATEGSSKNNFDKFIKDVKGKKS